MVALAAEQPGFLGIEPAREGIGASPTSITTMPLHGVRSLDSRG